MSQYYSANPIADFNRKDRDDQKWLDSRPKCYYCGDPIQTDACYCVACHKYCLDCAEAAAEAALPSLMGVTME